MLRAVGNGHPSIAVVLGLSLAGAALTTHAGTCSDAAECATPCPAELSCHGDADCAPGLTCWPSCLPSVCGCDDGSWTCSDDCVGVCDEDGVPGFDNCPLVWNPSQADTDADGVGDACDNCILIPNPGQEDCDGDGFFGDACEACPCDLADDADADTICAPPDNCPLAANRSQEDHDDDGVGDACDNCLFDYNLTQTDWNADFQGDVCDVDDGLIWIRFQQREYVDWQEETGFSSWNLYRGDLALLRASGVYTQLPGSNPLADRQCGLLVPYAFDPDPGPGQVAFHLATGSGSTDLGTDSAGNPRPNTNPCP